MKRSNRILIIALTILAIIGIPAGVFLAQQRQETRSRASESAILFFSPPTTSSAPLQKTVGQPVSFDIMVNPGSNRPSIIRLEIPYDTNLLDATSSPFVVNTDAFPTTQEGPFVQNGRVLITVSVGNDPSRAISQETKVGTVNFTARSTPGTTSITFGTSSQILSVASGDQANENVLATRVPAFITIMNQPTPTPTGVPTPTPTRIPTPTPTGVPTPTPTSGPTSSTLTCSPTTVALSDLMSSLEVILKNSSGVGIANKTVSWTSSNPGVSFSPPTSTTNTSGLVTTSAGVTNLSTPSFTATITARFAGDTTNTTSTCFIQATYTTRIPTPTPTGVPTPTPTRIPTPTPTSIPNATKLSFTVFLHAIGNSGDNANPFNFSFSNKNPLTRTRNLEVQILDSSDAVTAQKTGSMTYDSTMGYFRGVVDFGTSVPSTGSYNIKIKEKTHLKKLVPGFQTISIGQTNEINWGMTLIAGDVNNDNALNILDYNLIVGCYSDLAPAKSCTTTNKLLTDLDDNGAVNQFDYNLFLREITVQNGQ